MKLLDITIKDLLRFFRSPFALVMMFVAPLIFPALIFLAFGNMTSGGAGGGFNLPQVHVIIANLDQPDPQSGWSASKLLVEYLESQEVAAVISVTAAAGEAEARWAIQQQKADVAVIIPSGFTSAALAPDGAAEIVLVNEPTLKIGPDIVRSVISGYIEGLSGAKIAVRVADAQMSERGVTMSEDTALDVTGRFITWVQTTARDRSEASTTPPVRLTSPEGHPAATITSSGMIGPIMAAMIIFFVFFTAANGASRLIQEEEDGTLARLFTTPTYLSTILGGTFLFILVTLGFQSATLLMAARLLFGIRWGPPLALSLAVLALIIAASGLGFFLISFIRNTRQAGVVQGGVLTIMAMVGGLFTAFMADMPAALNTISLITPQGWALRSFKLVLTGAALDEVLPPMIILLATGLLFFAASVFNFRNRFAGKEC